MAIIDVVKWDGETDVLAYKFPEENLTTLTQLIVNESQEALLFSKGKLVQKFGAGKHTLSTENIPILENLYGIPFGGQNPFTAEVWFVNKVYMLDVKWGTAAPIRLREPEYKVVVPVRANGQFGIKIEDAEKFIVKLVGTVSRFDKVELSDCFKGLLMSSVTTIISSKIIADKISVLDIPAHLQNISDVLQSSMSDKFAEFGVCLHNFYVNSINIVDTDTSVTRLKSLLSKRAEMDILGYTYDQERSFDVLDSAAKNKGTSSAIMGAGMGLGMGFGVGGAVGGMMNNLVQGVQGGRGNQNASGVASELITCLSCNSKVLPNMPFCSGCGRSMTNKSALATAAVAANASVNTAKTPAITCDKCGTAIINGTKFCPSCGDLYNPCTSCGADNKADALTCAFCGKELPFSCPKCNNNISPGVKFCPFCGDSVNKTCSGCNEPIKLGSKFCSKCGKKI